MRIFTLLLLILGLVWASQHKHAHAQSPTPPHPHTPTQGLSVNASVGFADYVKIGRWAPLFVTVTYRGQPTSLEIRADFSVGMETTTTLIKRDKLADTARKMFVLYFRPNAYTDEVRVTARAGGRTATHIVQTEVVNQREPFVVILSDSRVGQNALFRPSGQYRYFSPWGSQQIQIVYADPRLLPDRWYGYHGVDLVMFSDISPRSISADAAKTLEQWVNGGGKLAVFGGVQGPAWKGTWIERLLPINIGETTRVVKLPHYLIDNYGGEVKGSVVLTDAKLKDKKALPFLRADWQNDLYGLYGLYGSMYVRVSGLEGLSSEGLSLVSAKDLLLVAMQRIGRGSVGFIAFDDWHAPIKDWVGLKNLIARMVSRMDNFRQIYYDVEAEEYGYLWHPVARAVADVPAMEVPPRRKVALLLLAYVVLLGPLHFFIGRKTRRLFAWVTFPLTIALFSGAAYHVGRNIKGQHVLVNEVALTETIAGAPVGHTRSLFGILSPDSASYAVAAVDDRTLLSRPPAQWGLGTMPVSFSKGRVVVPPTPPPYWAMSSLPGSSARQREEPNATFDETETLALKDMRIKWGAMELFRTESLDNLGKGIRARFTMDRAKDKLEGFIENGTPYDLEECFIILQQERAYSLASLPAGGKVTADKLKKLDWRKFERAYIGHYNPYDYSGQSAQKKLKPRERILRSLNQFIYWWSISEPRIMAWVKKPVSTVAVRPRAFESRKWQLLVVRGFPVEYKNQGRGLPVERHGLWVE